MEKRVSAALQQAAAAVAAADAILVGAGAGLGVDSGLPDFRGAQGFWRAYPRYAELGLDFPALANPRWFHKDPELAWGFYGHRLQLYRDTMPHSGFARLLGWAARRPHGAAVFTSNVDGQFQKAGFAAAGIPIHECHGSIHFLQCLRDCGVGLLPATGITVELSPQTLRATPPLPSCPRCHGLLRPSILMFGDAGWDSQQSEAQEVQLQRWLDKVLSSGARAVVIECGAGLHIPTVRWFCSESARRLRAPLLRINPRESEADSGGYEHIALPLGAAEALARIDALIG
ncbi:MAG TPA: Sir2 family NAD-dependent protein deacetylase [Pseudomonadota bacterium]|nr:Sir2 family NAD-dependent protein deacetylase [Pseudomonadota bacterium]